VAIAVAVVYGLALWKAPDWMHASKAADRYSARILVISLGGAVVVAAGLIYTARNYRLSRRGQVTDRFTKALERLGSSELYIRIGGIHALEHVMCDSRDHHDDITEVLAEFIRDRTPMRCRSVDDEHQILPTAEREVPAKPEPDVQASLTAIGHRPRRPERRAIDLAGLHLVSVVLPKTNLRGIRLSGADLSEADLTGADLTGAELTEADLTRGKLSGADLTCANLTGADLTGAELMDANLTQAELVRANLTDAHLNDANLTGTQLRDANLTRAWLYSVKFRGTRLRRANLAQAELEGANLSGARMADADLSGARLGQRPLAVPTGWKVTNPTTGELQPDLAPEL
jgi:uncharacterized protein YjbI with pentapeptide repeats